MNSLESGRRSVKLLIFINLFWLTILGFGITVLGLFIYLIATLVGSYQ